MLFKNWRTQVAQRLALSCFDFLVLLALTLGGAIYLHNSQRWGGAWIGDAQYGDAEFWWNNAIHIAQGILKDIPGKGFRAGYFILTGLSLPVLGLRFQEYYPYFLTGFLVACSFFYLVLRQYLGSWVAAFAVALLVINPYTAEWLATSTSDGLGLTLSIVALSFLLAGVYRRIHLGYLAAFAFFFALATLTRPLLNPFMGLLVLILIFLPQESYKRKLLALLCILLAFAMPTFLWMGIQKVTIDRWSISSNDASAFYAASDPSIQVWNNEMYRPIQQRAMQKHHLKEAEVTDAILNQTFWEEAVNNYQRYPHYHLSRLLPNLWELARFSPKQARHGSLKGEIILLDLLACGLGLGLILRGRLLKGALLLFCAFWIAYKPQLLPVLTLFGAALALVTLGKNNRLGLFLLAVYWLTGVMSLYLIGGTWGLPSFSGGRFAINALGYRLGSQFFFIGPILIAYFLVRLAAWNGRGRASALLENTLLPYWNNKPRAWVGQVVVCLASLFLLALVAVYSVGSAKVIGRALERHEMLEASFPSLEPVLVQSRERGLPNPQLVKGEEGRLPGDSLNLAAQEERTLIFSGIISNFIWDLKGQARSQMLIHVHAHQKPFRLGPGSLTVEVPQNPIPKAWAYQQGAFIINYWPNRHLESTLPFYLSVPALRGFIPLAADGQHYDWQHAQWFDLYLNAGQLETAGLLRVQGAKVLWSGSSGKSEFQRRFFLEPTSMQEGFSTVALSLELKRIKGPATLSLAYKADKADYAISIPEGAYELRVKVYHKGKKQPELLIKREESYRQERGDRELVPLVIALASDYERLDIEFGHLSPGAGLWIHEYNLLTPELQRNSTKTERIREKENDR